MMYSHYLWGLFVPDERQAQDALRNLWIKKMINTNQAAHWALNIGDREWVRQLERTGELTRKCKDAGKGISFRQARADNIYNPYEKLVKLTESEKNEILENIENMWVSLDGGIGDHVEDMNIITTWMNKQNKTLNIISTKMREIQLRRLFYETRWKSMVNEEDKIISSKVLLCALGKGLVNPNMKILVKSDKEKIKNNGIICCWNAIGTEDKLSQWIRSVPFKDVWQFYKQLIRNDWIPSTITDCSKWRKWEKEKLHRLGIRTYDPETGDALQLAEEINNHKIVISIDSAMAHISAGIKKEMILLLPKYSDERWVQLLRINSSYDETCKVVKQKQYGVWVDVVERLGDEITHSWVI